VVYLEGTDRDRCCTGGEGGLVRRSEVEAGESERQSDRGVEGAGDCG